MNVNPAPDQRIDTQLWEQRDVRLALARRDISAVFGLLNRRGISQRQLAAMTGQAQSEICAILNGRQVMAYDLLVRIAEGLSIPHGYLGLSYDPETAEVVASSLGASPRTEDDRDAAWTLIGHAAQVTMGAVQIDVERWWVPVPHESTPAAERIGDSDVEQIEGITEVLRALDYRHGGGSCRDAVVAQVTRAQQHLHADCVDDVRRRLHVALADLHNLAGWTSFDVGLHTSANQHFLRALELARHVDDSSLVANVLYRMGRLQLHRSQGREALKLFQLGQIAAQDSGCELTVAMLCANEAMAYALLDDDAQALKSMGRAQDEFARSEHASAPTWVRFFGSADLIASIGVLHATLPTSTPTHRRKSISALTQSLAERGHEMDRSRAFELAALATVHLLGQDLDHATKLGNKAVDLAEQVRSTRIVDRLTPLRREAARRPRHADCRVLADRIATLQAT